MKRETINNVVVFCVLIVLGVATRWMSDQYKPVLSNFTALGASALFSGFYFRNRLAAVLLPLAVIVISNLCLTLMPFNNFGQFAVVYIALLLPVAIGMLVRRYFNFGTLIGGSLASSLSFYLITNFAEWPFHKQYPHTLGGLLDSYIAGIPFFGRTLAGDLFFTAAIFGIYWAVASMTALARQPELARIASE